MPGLAQRNAQFSNAYSSTCSAGSVSSNGIWSKHRDVVTFDQLQKFWSELSPRARHELLKIDKQTLLEQARKNLYCSRCNGLLLEGFSQIFMYGKSLQQDASTCRHLSTGKIDSFSNQTDSESNVKSPSCHDVIQDPSVHPWGGLVATREGVLTLLDCFLGVKSLKALQNVFNSARVRERERELLYPDACGGGGRGWISQGITNYGRGHGTRETCALHTARLSCDTLVDFWSALGDETRKSLLRMKEEDFIERLMYRFDSKRFCRDCRRNVIREFKELKELKRMRREPRCTSWFCVADSAFQYEVSDEMVQVDWRQSFIDNVGTYHHFEWAVGTAEGKSDILEFEDVGMNGTVQVSGLDLGGLTACFITLRAWRLDGRCTEICVKAHAMKGQPCVHRRLVVGDGYVMITKGESIRRFFEHAEEAEEEEEDDAMDKDGNEFDGEGSRPQKHAKSPELAREFLLDAATVIFKEQVEKAFREGTARQNAHSIFVCLALKLLEERVHVACKEIITLEKQNKLLEEEEKEKRQEEERKERKRAKEREKKLRRKERLKDKEREREKNCVELNQGAIDSKMSLEESSPDANEEPSNNISSEDSISETGENMVEMNLLSAIKDGKSSYGRITLNMKNDTLKHSVDVTDGDLSNRDGSESFIIEQSKASRRKLRFRKEMQLDKRCDRRQAMVANENGEMVDESEPGLHVGYVSNPPRYINGMNRQLRNNPVKFSTRACSPKFSDKFHTSTSRGRDRCDFNSCGCNLQNDYRTKDGMRVSAIRACQEIKSNKLDSASDVSKPFYRNSKYNNGCYMADRCGISKCKPISSNIPSGREFHVKKVWEPTEESRKRYPRSNSDSDVALRTFCFKTNECEKGTCDGDSNDSNNTLKSLAELYGNSGTIGLNNCQNHEDDISETARNPTPDTGNSCTNESIAPAADYSMNDGEKEVELGPPDVNMSSTSSSDNCSSCLSEGDSSAASSSSQNAELWSTSDSEDTSQQSEGRDTSAFGENAFQKCLYDGSADKHLTNGDSFSDGSAAGFPAASCPVEAPAPKGAANIENGRITVDVSSSLQHHMVLPMHNQGIHLPVITTPSAVSYYHQNPVSWSAAPANGLMSFPQPSRYVFSGPLGYGLPMHQPSHFCVQYGGIQPLPTSMLNVGHLPSYQPINKPSFANPKEQIKNSKLLGVHESTINAADAAPRGHCKRPVENSGPPYAAAPSLGQNAKTFSMHNDSTNFSLFHFGGPMPVANSPPDSLKEAAVEDLCMKSDHPKSGYPCSKQETTIEEYSLFSANNGTRFSFLTNC